MARTDINTLGGPVVFAMHDLGKPENEMKNLLFPLGGNSCLNFNFQFKVGRKS